jgi:HsdM-like protein
VSPAACNCSRRRRVAGRDRVQLPRPATPRVRTRVRAPGISQPGLSWSWLLNSEPVDVGEAFKRDGLRPAGLECHQLQDDLLLMYLVDLDDDLSTVADVLATLGARPCQTSPVATPNMMDVERRLWAAADELRSNSNLTAVQYRDPVLGLIFLAFAEQRFDVVGEEIETSSGRRRRPGPAHYHARGVLYLAEEARLSTIASLAEGSDFGALLNVAMKAIERENPELAGVLPQVYARLGKSTLVELIRLLAPLGNSPEGDAFGLVYEYFLAAFAMQEGRGGGEFLSRG